MPKEEQCNLVPKIVLSQMHSPAQPQRATCNVPIRWQHRWQHLAHGRAATTQRTSQEVKGRDCVMRMSCAGLTTLRAAARSQRIEQSGRHDDAFGEQGAS